MALFTTTAVRTSNPTYSFHLFQHIPGSRSPLYWYSRICFEILLSVTLPALSLPLVCINPVQYQQLYFSHSSFLLSSLFMSSDVVQPLLPNLICITGMWPHKHCWNTFRCSIMNRVWGAKYRFRLSKVNSWNYYTIVYAFALGHNSRLWDNAIVLFEFKAYATEHVTFACHNL
jgi:hypothetical protein